MNSNFYSPTEQNPFDVLGVEPGADARKILKAQNEKLEELRYSKLPEKERVARTEEIKEAYETLRSAPSKAPLEFFLFNPDVGSAESDEQARNILDQPIDVSEVIESGDDIFVASPQQRHNDTPSHDLTLPAHEKLEETADQIPHDRTESILETIVFDV